MDVISLNHLCDVMQKEGYQFASLSLNPFFSFSQLNDIIMEESAEKPIPAWYFSKIEWCDIEKQWTLSWAEWCKYENFHIAKYSKDPICFAKFDTSKMVFDVLQYKHSQMNRFGHYEYNWNQMNKDGFHGVFYDTDDLSYKNDVWDVPTIAIWNPNDCIYSVKYFENAGPWEYYWYPAYKV